MLDPSLSLAEPLNQEVVVPGSVHSGRKVLTVVSLFASLGVVMLLSCGGFGQHLAAQELMMAAALPHVQQAKIQPFVRAARVSPFMQPLKASSLPSLRSRSQSWPVWAEHEQVAEPVLREEPVLSRRESLLGAATAAALAAAPVSPSLADSAKTIVVAGATGQTGRRVLEKLASKGGLTVIGGVRDVAKAEKTLNEASVTVRGAMVQNVPSVDTSAVTLSKLDVVAESADALAATLKGAEALIIATGFVPGNPFEMAKAANAVDNKGTVKLVDAAKLAGVPKVVMISSILTDADAWGQRGSPGFVVTNAFGGVLDEKLVAEKYLRSSGVDYTIVRPGGLKAQPPAGKLLVYGENKLKDGEISRDLVADVMIDAAFNSDFKNKVVEIIEEGTSGELKPQDMVGSR